MIRDATQHSDTVRAEKKRMRRLWANFIYEMAERKALSLDGEDGDAASSIREAAKRMIENALYDSPDSSIPSRHGSCVSVPDVHGRAKRAKRRRLRGRTEIGVRDDDTYLPEDHAYVCLWANNLGFGCRRSVPRRINS